MNTRTMAMLALGLAFGAAGNDMTPEEVKAGWDHVRMLWAFLLHIISVVYCIGAVVRLWRGSED